MQISRKDIYWNYAATFFKLASAAIILPFILRFLPSETVGIWTVFMTISTFSYLLDFGFNPTFSRNVTYVLSGVRNLKKDGFEILSEQDNNVDYSLLKGLIRSMKWIYLRLSLILFIALISFGTYYIFTVLKTYTGNPKEVYISWFILILINSYYIYSLYYESLLIGKGLIKKSKQIIVFGQSTYLITAIVLILNGFGLIAIVSAQAISVIINRWLLYKAFFTNEVKESLRDRNCPPVKYVLQAIYPNAIKIGLTSLGSFLVQRSAILIGSFYLSLSEIASYGITLQLILIISTLSLIYSSTYQPKISQQIVYNNYEAVKEIYIKGQICLFFTYFVCGIGLILLGDEILKLIGSKTLLLSKPMISVFLIISLLEANQSLAGTILLSKNEVPFFKASLVAGLITVLLLFILFENLEIKLWSAILAQGIANLLYNNWKWPHVVYKLLNVNLKDIKTYMLNIKKEIKWKITHMKLA